MENITISFDTISVELYIRERQAALSDASPLTLKAEGVRLFSENGFSQRFCPNGWRMCICRLPRGGGSALVWTRDVDEQQMRSNVRKHLALAYPVEDRPVDQTGTPMGFSIDII